MKKFFYNVEKDLHVVDTVMAGVDLREAYVQGSVPAGLVGSELAFNDVDDPSAVMNRPSDEFEARRQTAYVKGALKKVADAKTEAATDGS